MSGGAGVMMADACVAGGLDVAPLTSASQMALEKVLPDFVGKANPVDSGPVYGDPDAIEACVDIAAADPNIDVLLVFMGLSPGMAGIIEPRLARVQERSGKPVITAWMGGPAHGIASLRKAGIATFDDPSRAVEMAIQLVRAARPLQGRDLPLAALPSEARAIATQGSLRAAMTAGQGALSEREVKVLMASYGIPVVPEILATTAIEADAAGRQFKCLLAVKAESPDLLHKSDAGAVRLRVPLEDVAHAFTEVVAAASAAVGPDRVRGALIQPMARPGLEILAGLRYDPQFGPTITVGMGGLTGEVLADVITELAPVNLEMAHSMLQRLRCAPLLGPFRGAMPRDSRALAQLLVALSDFSLDAGPLLAELDLNPVIVHDTGDGCTVVDGAAVLGRD
jgi:acyl-CoA synthetase (NDP forming)